MDVWMESNGIMEDIFTCLNVASHHLPACLPFFTKGAPRRMVPPNLLIELNKLSCHFLDVGLVPLHLSLQISFP